MELLVYPLGPVTLSLPIDLPPGADWMEDELSITYMACSANQCKPPVEGKIVPAESRAQMRRKISEQRLGKLMNKKILLALIGFSLLACNFLFPPKGTPAPETNNDVFPISEKFTIIRLHPSDGDLKTLLASEGQKAAAQDQMPVVEFDATWCPPCKAIDEGIKEKNKLMLDAYDGTYIIKLDVDEWGWGNI